MFMGIIIMSFWSCFGGGGGGGDFRSQTSHDIIRRTGG